MVSYQIEFKNLNSLRRTGKRPNDIVFSTPNTKKLAVSIVNELRRKGYRGKVRLNKSLAGTLKVSQRVNIVVTKDRLDFS